MDCGCLSESSWNESSGFPDGPNLCTNLLPASTMYTLLFLSMAMLAGSCRWPGPSPFAPHAPRYSSGGPAGFSASALDSNSEQPEVQEIHSADRIRVAIEARLLIKINLSQLRAGATLNRGGWDAVINGACGG